MCVSPIEASLVVEGVFGCVGSRSVDALAELAVPVVRSLSGPGSDLFDEPAVQDARPVTLETESFLGVLPGPLESSAAERAGVVDEAPVDGVGDAALNAPDDPTSGFDHVDQPTLASDRGRGTVVNGDRPGGEQSTTSSARPAVSGERGVAPVGVPGEFPAEPARRGERSCVRFGTELDLCHAQPGE